jgi:hypothetical protein
VTDAAPVDRFGRDARIAVLLGDGSEYLFGVRKFLLHKIDARHSHFESRTKPVPGQVTFDAVLLDPIRVHHQHARSPQRRKAFEPGRMFLDVSFERDESLIDEVGSFLIRV